MGNIKKAIVFVGNTGVGKSYICNKIFESCGSSLRFESTSSVVSVTPTLQQGPITFHGQNYTVVDSPGFFDTSNNSNGENNVDGRNMCKLVQALESCEEIYAIVFVFTDRFSMPHKMWFDRIVDLITKGNRGQILLVQNKSEQPNLELLSENKAQINHMLGGGVKQPYSCFGYNAAIEETVSLLKTVTTMTPFQLTNLVTPEICYESEVQGAEYDELIAESKKDEGRFVDEIKDTSHQEEYTTWDNSNIFGLFGIRGPGAKVKKQLKCFEKLILFFYCVGDSYKMGSESSN